MRRISIMRYVAVTVGVLLVLMCLEIYWELASKVVLTNDSAYELANVQIGVEKSHGILSERFWQGDLPPGTSAWAGKISDHSGVLSVSFEINGEKKNIDLGYVGLPVSRRINVRSKDDMIIAEIPKLSDFVRR